MLANPRTLRGVVETLLFCVFLYINAFSKILLRLLSGPDFLKNFRRLPNKK